MSAERLREAARVLREGAAILDDKGPWSWHVTGDRKWAVVTRDDGEWMAQVDDDDRAVYIATMHPGVGLALADLLDMEAWRNEQDFDFVDLTHSYAIADLILGGEQS